MNNEAQKFYMVVINMIGDNYGTNVQLVGIYDSLEKAEKAKEKNSYSYLPYGSEAKITTEESRIIEVIINKTYDTTDEFYTNKNDKNVIRLGYYIE